MVLHAVTGGYLDFKIACTFTFSKKLVFLHAAMAFTLILNSMYVYVFGNSGDLDLNIMYDFKIALSFTDLTPPPPICLYWGGNYKV